MVLIAQCGKVLRLPLRSYCLDNRISQFQFDKTLGGYRFNHYAMLVVDLLHEFELGIWKAIFKHLINLLYAAAPVGHLVTELDHQ